MLKIIVIESFSLCETILLISKNTRNGIFSLNYLACVTNSDRIEKSTWVCTYSAYRFVSETLVVTNCYSIIIVIVAYIYFYLYGRELRNPILSLNLKVKSEKLCVVLHKNCSPHRFTPPTRNINTACSWYYNAQFIGKFAF